MQAETAMNSSDHQRIEAVNRSFTEHFNAGDIEGAARAVYTRDARVLPPGAAVVRGLDSIVEFWRGAAEALGITAVELSTSELNIHGDSAHEIGGALLTVAGGEQQAQAKYVVVWKKEEGQWRWDIDIWNMNEWASGGASSSARR